jgi:hypothetical protein
MACQSWSWHGMSIMVLTWSWHGLNLIFKQPIRGLGLTFNRFFANLVLNKMVGAPIPKITMVKILKVQSNLVIRNFSVAAKLFLKVKCSLLQIVHYWYYRYHIGYQFILDLAQDPKKMYFFVGNNTYYEELRKNGFFFKSIISLVPKGFHVICESQIFGILFRENPKIGQNFFLKSPFWLIFTILCSLIPNFGISWIGKSSLSQCRKTVMTPPRKYSGN